MNHRLRRGPDFLTYRLLENHLLGCREHCVLCGKMTAKHRKGKSNNKHEENFFKNEITESEVRTGGNNYIVMLVLLLVVVIGAVIGTWFCFQQHQTLSYLTDNVIDVQMKIGKLQSSHEDLRQSSGKVIHLFPVKLSVTCKYTLN